MGDVFSKPKAPRPDTSGINAQRERLERQRKEEEARRLEQEAKLEREEGIRKRRRQGRGSLIATSETGVSSTTG